MPESSPVGGQSEPSPADPPPDAERRSSVGIRVALYFFTVFMALSLGASLLVRLLEGPGAVERMAQATEIEPVYFLWLRLALLPIVLLTTLFFVRRADRNKIAHVGLTLGNSPQAQLILATILAAVPLGLWLMLADPWVDSKLGAWSPEALAADPHLPLGATGLMSLLVGFLGMAFLDELIFRGYVFSTFRERFTWVHAGGLANLLSVSVHAGHPDIGAAGIINAFLLGWVLAALRERSGSLLMPTVFLGVWTILLGSVLSLPVDGTLFPRLFDHSMEGPVGLTGGSYGPSGSWLLTGLLLSLVMALAWWVESASKTDHPQAAAEPAA